jgi:hypothetical protein
MNHGAIESLTNVYCVLVALGLLVALILLLMQRR